MKKINYLLSLAIMLVFLLTGKNVSAQSSSPAPYCLGGYSSGNCNQGGPSNTPGNVVNDFINSFNTEGGNTNITNNNSGCNNGPNNYINYGCTNYLTVTPGQTIVANVQSGIIYSQGFAIFIDWNQDNTFNLPSELVAFTPGVPAAGTWSALTFTIPPLQAPGSYRLRVRCAFATNGNAITPCGNFGYGETEDYTIYVAGSNNQLPPGIITGTATNSAPVCEGQTFSLNVATSLTTATTYTWSGPSGFTSIVQNPVVANALPNMNGVYTVTVANGACPISVSTTVVVVPLPQYTVTPMTTTVCQNGSFIVAANSNNPLLYTYLWSGPVIAQSPNGSSTLINTLPITTSTALVTYSIIVTPTALNCPVTTTMSVRINNPATPTLTLPGQLCSTLSSTFATASPPGGTWYGNPIVASNGIISPNTATVFGTYPVSYSITIGSCTANATGNISVSQYNTAALTGSIPGQCVQNVPFNLMSIVQNTNGIWSGVGVALNTFTAAGLPTGPYVLNYYNPSVPYPNVCPANSTVAVNVFNPPTPIITPITPKCTNSPSVQLLVSPTGGVWTGNSGFLPTVCIHQEPA